MALLLSLSARDSFAAQPVTRRVTLSGTVRDTSGAAVQGAGILLRDPEGSETLTTSNARGDFVISDVHPGEVVLVVRAAGFSPKEERLTIAEQDRLPVTVVLLPATIVDAVTVTAARQEPIGALTGAASILNAADLASSPSVMLDDKLKSIPGFSLFRRTSSRTSNPTTQGVTMRGLSSSGASRTLVLVDGVPLNDAFGGWIPWSRIPQTAIERVEILAGATSDMYGTDALSGVIQILTLAPSHFTLRSLADFGSRNTPLASAFVGGAKSGWSGFGSIEAQRSDGYIIQAPEQRGPIDTPAAARYRTVYGTGRYQAANWSAALRGNVFGENRLNGTPLQTNKTSARDLSGELSGSASNSLWLVRGYGGTQDYDQSFTAIDASRTFETMTGLQHVPSSKTGATAQWSVLAGRTSWLLGGDVQRRVGSTNDRVFVRGIETGITSAGGVESDVGAFLRAELALARNVGVAGAVRADHWRLSPDAPASSTQVATELSPRVGVTWRAVEGVAAYATVTNAFRTPTLNELFRNFRVGNVVTNANDRLRPETLSGVDAGVSITRGPASARVSTFWNQLSDAITNRTVSSTPTLITRIRANAGTIHAGGVDLLGEWQILPSVRATVGAEFVHSVYSDSAEPEIVGKRVAQVPKVQTSAAARVNAPFGVLAVVQLRYNSTQFDDDLNRFLLGSATIVDFSASRAMGGGVELFGAVENLSNDDYDVGRTPTRTIGLPRTVRGGIRWIIR